MALESYEDQDLRRKALIGRLTGDDAPVSTIDDPPVTAPFQGSTDASRSRYAPQIVERNGRTYLQEHGNERWLQGDEIQQGKNYATAFWQQNPTGFQPDVGGGLTATGAPVGAQTNAGYQQTGWGFDSPTGGRREFQYTPQRYSGSMANFSGFSPTGEGSSDPSALKNIFRDAALGLAEGPDGFTEAGVDEAVRRLNAMGIPATKVDPYQIDFGNGEGPIQVRSSRNEVWWNNRATENQAPTSQVGGSSRASSVPTLGDDSLSRAQALIQSLINSGYDRDALLKLLQA